MADKNHPQTTVLQRFNSYEAVIWALDTQWPLAEQALDPRGASLAEGPSPYSLVVERLRQELDAVYGKLWAAHNTLLAERTRDTEAREERDAAERALLEEINAGRSVFAGAYGPDKLESLGFTTRIPENTNALVAQAEFVDRQIAENAGNLPAARDGFTADPEVFLEKGLRPAIARLKKAVGRVGREVKVTETAVLAKDKALEEFNSELQGIAHIVEAFFRKAGLPEVAARVRPSGRRRGTTVVPFSDGTAADDEAGGDSPNEDPVPLTLPAEGSETDEHDGLLVIGTDDDA